MLFHLVLITSSPAFFFFYRWGNEHLKGFRILPIGLIYCTDPVTFVLHQVLTCLSILIHQLQLPRILHWKRILKSRERTLCLISNVSQRLEALLVVRILFAPPLLYIRAFPGGASGKEPACQCRRHKKHGFKPWVWKIHWRWAWRPTLAFLHGESHGQRS